MEKINNIAELKQRVGIANSNISLLGYYSVGDGGGGEFYWDNTSTETDNGGTIIQVIGVTTGRWKRIFQGYIDVRWFGAKGDNLTNDSISFQNAIDFCETISGTLLIPNGTFLIKDVLIGSFTRIISNTYNLNFWITGSKSVVKPYSGAIYVFDFKDGSTNSCLENIYIDGDSFSKTTLVSAIRLRGRFHSIYKSNIVNCTRHAVYSSAGNMRIIESNFQGLQSNSITYSDYVATFHITSSGDNYIVNNEFGGGSLYTSYKDPVNYRSVAFYAASINNSVISGNIFEVSDKGCVVSGTNNNFSQNRYEFNNAGGLQLVGLLQSAFIGERFANNSVVQEGAFDNLEILFGSGSILFVNPIFNSQNHADFSTKKVRYNISNTRPNNSEYRVSILSPLFSSNSSLNGNYNSNSGFYAAEDIDINILNKYNINNTAVLSKNTNYTELHDAEGVSVMKLGKVAINANFYDNGTHVFRDRTGSEKFRINIDSTVTLIPLTTTQINLLSKTSGKMAYNSTTSKPVWCDGSTWKYADGTSM